MTTATFAPPNPVATHPQLGGVFGGQLPYGPQPGQYHPALAQQQLAPYGLIGELIRAIAPTGGQMLGSAFGDPQAGGQLGQLVGQLGGLLPFGAQQGYPQQQVQQIQQAQIQQALVQQAIAQAQAQQQVQQLIAQAQIQQALARQPLSPYAINGVPNVWN